MEDIPTYYDRLAPDYDASRFGHTYGQFLHAQERRALRSMLSGIPAAATLDLACGTGRLLEFADTGLDLSANMIAAARGKYPDKILLTGDATRLPFPDASFEAVFSLHFFMHIDREQAWAVLAEVWRVLRPGGRFIVDFPSQKRRQFTSGHHQRNWHGSYAANLSDWANDSTGAWQLLGYRGIQFLPIHRFPAQLRLPLLPLDQLLCRSPWREWASYILLALVKK